MSLMLDKLSGGDLRSEGRAAAVAAEVIAQPVRLADLAKGLRSEDDLIRARTCMALEVISRDHPALLTFIAPQLVELAARERVPQARWHLAETLGRVALSDEQLEQIIDALLAYLADGSKIVRYTAVETLGMLGGSSDRRNEIIEKISSLRGMTKSLDKAVVRALRTLHERIS